MYLKTFIAAVALAGFSIPAWALFDSLWRVSNAIYQPGDCIEPTDQSVSFYGHYARVEGVLDFDGTQEPGVYYLSFLGYVPRTPLHAQSIEQKTRQVDGELCEKPGSNHAHSGAAQQNIEQDHEIIKVFQGSDEMFDPLRVAYAY